MFPKWNPGRHTISKFTNLGKKEAYQFLRISSDNFIKKEAVRQFIFERDHYKCVMCGSKENLTIDHKISVYQASIEKSLIKILNNEENLQTLCLKCNSGKNP